MLYSFDLSIGRIAQFTFLRIILSIGSAGVKGSGIIDVYKRQVPDYTGHPGSVILDGVVPVKEV